jgi:predicted dehydrogenase
MVQVGLIGTGYIGPIHLNALARIGGVKVKRVADVNGELARKAAADYNIESFGTDWREVVSDPGIDVIHNCTPNKYHFQINKEALNQGKQVFTEKPLCLSLKEAEELVNLAEKKKAVTGIGFCYRYYPMVQEMSARVRRGDAGAVRLVTGTWFQDWLSRETDWTWRLLSAESGESNITADLGSHWFDLIQFVTGLEVKRVIGDLATLIPVRRQPKRQVLAFEKIDQVEAEEVKVELEDYSSVLFRLSNGAPGSFTTSQVCAGRKSDTEFQVYGEKCSYAWNHREATALWIGHRDRPNEVLVENATLQDPSTARYSTLPAGHPQGYYEAMMHMFKDYYEALQGRGTPLRATFETGRWEMRILEAILASQKQGRWTEVKA